MLLRLFVVFFNDSELKFEMAPRRLLPLPPLLPPPFVVALRSRFAFVSFFNDALLKLAMPPSKPPRRSGGLEPFDLVSVVFFAFTAASLASPSCFFSFESLFIFDLSKLAMDPNTFDMESLRFAFVESTIADVVDAATELLLDIMFAAAVDGLR